MPFSASSSCKCSIYQRHSKLMRMTTYCSQYTIHTQFIIRCAFVLYSAILRPFCTLNISKDFIGTYQQPAKLMSLASLSQCQIFKEFANFLAILAVVVATCFRRGCNLLFYLFSFSTFISFCVKTLMSVDFSIDFPQYN